MTSAAPPGANTAKEGASPRDEPGSVAGHRFRVLFCPLDVLTTCSSPEGSSLLSSPALIEAVHPLLHSDTTNPARESAQPQPDCVCLPTPTVHTPSFAVSLRIYSLRPPCATVVQPCESVTLTRRTFGPPFPSALPAQVAERSFIYPPCGQVYRPHNILSLYIYASSYTNA
ncbi:hypothetical protein C8Q79DRAFT_669823 [Trametes meyenii]|nr:hypothetical protein C8Q79DRAFT_669823 [Trametes meyenii]